MHVQVCKKDAPRHTASSTFDKEVGAWASVRAKHAAGAIRHPLLYTCCMQGGRARAALKLGHADLAIGMRSFRRFLVPSLLFSDSLCFVRFRRPSSLPQPLYLHPSLAMSVLHCSHSFYLIQFSTPPRRKAEGESSLRPGGSGSLLLNCANKRNRDSRSRGAPCNQGGSF